MTRLRSRNRPNAIAMLSAAILTLLALLILLVDARRARADAIDDALSLLATDRFPDTEKAIGAIAGSGLETASDIFDALAANRLFFDPRAKRIFIGDRKSTRLNSSH